MPRGARCETDRCESTRPGKAHLELSLKQNIVVNLIGSIKDRDKSLIIEQTSLQRTSLQKEVNSLNGGSTFTPFQKLKNKVTFYADDSL